MTSKIIFNWLIGIFAVLTAGGFVLGIYSYTHQFYLEKPELWATLGVWLFIGCGIACVVCVIVRITLGMCG